MKTSKFKTNSKCGGCVARKGEKLDKMIPGQEWDIDLTTPERILTVTSDEPDDKIVAAVVDAGYKAEKL